jgi:hypothetical protein
MTSRRKAPKRKTADRLPPRGRRGAGVRSAPGYTRLVREQGDRPAFFGVLSLAVLLAGLAVTLAGAGAGVVLLLVGLIGVLACVGNVVVWRRRYHAARVTGRREATVTIGSVHAEPPVHRVTLGPVVAVTFPDGSRIDVRAADAGWTVRGRSELPALPALVGGHGPAMVLLVLPRPPWWTRPHVFAAKAVAYRRPPEA